MISRTELSEKGWVIVHPAPIKDDERQQSVYLATLTPTWTPNINEAKKYSALDDAQKEVEIVYGKVIAFPGNSE